MNKINSNFKIYQIMFKKLNNLKGLNFLNELKKLNYVSKNYIFINIYNSLCKEINIHSSFFLL